ncbi:MAG: ATP-dependent Clp protease adaptor ClpS [Minicystis sp.]
MDGHGRRGGCFSPVPDSARHNAARRPRRGWAGLPSAGAMTTQLEQILGLNPPSNPEIVGIPFVILHTANESKTIPGDPHTVEALLRISSVADALTTLGVDVARAREGVKRIIAALPQQTGLKARFRMAFRPMESIDPFHRVRANARAAGLKELTACFALAVLVGEPAGNELLRALEDAGFSLLRYRWYVAHRLATDAPCPESGQVRVVFHNDPFTTMEFVVEMLTKVFGRDQATAEVIMRRVHEEGSAALATMDAAVAARGLAELRSQADAGGWPLRVSVQQV